MITKSGSVRFAIATFLVAQSLVVLQAYGAITTATPASALTSPVMTPSPQPTTTASATPTAQPAESQPANDLATHLLGYAPAVITVRITPKRLGTDATAPNSLATNTGAQEVAFAPLPITLTVPNGSFAEQVDVRLEVITPALVSQISPVSVAFKLDVRTMGSQPMVSSLPLTLTLNYGQVNLQYGGDFASRLALYRASDCSMSALAGEIQTCKGWQILTRQNNLLSRNLVVQLGDSAATDSDSLYILASDSSGPGGDYTATPINMVTDYQVGLFSGSAETSYDIPVPPAASGAAPRVQLTYSSGSVDGMNTSKNTQPSWVGTGWNLQGGSISRVLKTCGTSHAPGDLCLAGDIFTIALNGVSSKLVKEGANLYRLQSDPRWKVEMFTDAPSGHPDAQGQYWWVTTPDGVRYRFGGEFEPETEMDQNSAFYVTIYDPSADNTVCSTNIYHLCNKVWQWNLDRAEDRNGNVISYWYEQELNYYKALSDSTPTFRRQYVRAGNMSRIDYTKRSGQSVQPNARVLFKTEMRCSNVLNPTQCTWPADFKDTPGDLLCADTGNCNQSAPTFWTQKRLGSVQTQVYNQGLSTWRTAAIYDFNYSFPSSPSSLDTSRLFLTDITQRPGGDFNVNAFSQIEAESYDLLSGVNVTTSQDVGSGYSLGSIHDGDWVMYRSVGYGAGAASLVARVQSTSKVTVEMRLDSITGTLVSQLVVPDLHGATSTLTTTVSGATGVHDTYLVFRTLSANSMNLNWLRFTPASALPGLPRRQFAPAMLPNRMLPPQGDPPMYIGRIVTITTELGGQISFSYSTPYDTNYSPCYNHGSNIRLPCNYYADWYQTAWIWFWKYDVTQMQLSDSVGSPVQVVTYTYSTPNWHYSDNAALPEVNQCNQPCHTNYWNQFNGHAIVTATISNGAKTENRYYTGMDGDRLGESGGSYTASIALSDGSTRTDSDWLKGQAAEVRQIGTAGVFTNSMLNRTVSIYTATLTAGSAITGSYFVAPQIITSTAYGTITKTIQDEIVYDSYGNVTLEMHRGDVSTTSDARTIERRFIYSPTIYMVNRLQWEKLWTGTTPSTSGNEQSYRAFGYDGATVGITPTKGNLTLVRAYSQVTPTALYVESTTGYDTYGRPITTTDANNNTALTTYDPFYGYVRTITNALTQTVTTLNDPRWGVPLVITDSNGTAVTQQYDDYGRRIKVWLPTEPITGVASYEYVYSLDARPVSVQQRTLMQRNAGVYLQNWTYYDGLGREIQSQRPDVTPNMRVVTSKAYDATGRVLYTSSPYSVTGVAGNGYVTPTWSAIANYSHTGYDDLGNLTLAETKSYANLLWAKSSRYDAWQQRHTDANGNPGDQSYDAFGKLIAVTEYNTSTTGIVSNTMRYGYNALGNLTIVTDALTNTSVITYDLLGRKTGMLDPDMGGWSYHYDPNGNLITQTDALSTALVMQYDGLNRLIAKRTITGALISELVFDATGQSGLLSISKAYNGEGTAEVRNVTYDARNRVTQRQWIIPGAGGGTFRMDYGYDEADNQVTLRYPGGNNGEQGELVTRSYYTQTGALNRVVSEDGTPFISYTLYSPQGQVTQQQLDQSPNGLTRQFTYDVSTLRLSSLSAGITSPWNDLQNLSYAYALNGNITSLVDGVNSSQRQCFQYDQLSRLTAAFSGDASCASYSSDGVGAYNHTYAYDAIGNITSYNGNAYTYSAKPHAVTAAFSNTYVYDANGNQILRRIAPYTHTLTYDAQGRMTGVSAVRDPVTSTITDTSRLTHTLYLPLVSNGATAIVTAATYLYDADGMRVKGEVGGVTTVYIAGVYEWQAGATTKYYDGGAMRRTGYASGNGIFFILKDHLGSTSVIVSQEGVMQATNYYYPYGANRGGSAFSELTSKQFTGQYGASSLAGSEGLSYYGARWYDAQLGRFVSADTIVPRAGDPQSFNRYSYVSNSPLMYIDPTGHFGCIWAACKEAVGTGTYVSSEGNILIASIGRTVRAPVWRNDGRIPAVARARALTTYLYLWNNPSAFANKYQDTGSFGKSDASIDLVLLTTETDLGTGDPDQLVHKVLRERLGMEIANAVLTERQSNLNRPPDDENSQSGSIIAGVIVGGTKLVFDTYRHMSRALSVEGWTVQDIINTLSHPAQVQTGGTNFRTGNPATVYFRGDGQYVMVDDMTGEIFHVSNTNRMNWIDPFGERLRNRP